MKKNIGLAALSGPPSTDLPNDPETALAHAEAPSLSTTVAIEFDATRLGEMTAEEIAAAINQTHDDAKRCLGTAKERLKEGLFKTLCIGRCILEISNKTKEPWLQWMKVHCPGIAPSTAYRYRELAKKFPHVRNADGIGSTRQAYLAAGILPPAETKKKKKPHLTVRALSQPADFVAGVRSFRQQWAIDCAQIDFAVMEAPARGHLETELRQIIAAAEEALERMRSVVPVAGVMEGLPQ